VCMSDTLKYDTVWKLTWPTVKYNYETIILRRLNYMTIKEKEIFLKIRLKKLIFSMILE